MHRQWELFMQNHAECDNANWPALIRQAEEMTKAQQEDLSASRDGFSTDESRK